MLRFEPEPELEPIEFEDGAMVPILAEGLVLPEEAEGGCGKC